LAVELPVDVDDPDTDGLVAADSVAVVFVLVAQAVSVRARAAKVVA
jgi:hypothetical protein